MSEIGYHLTYKSIPKPLFSTTSQLNDNSMVYIFETKHDVLNRSNALQTTKGPLTSSQNDMYFAPQTA